jgi:dolichol-phosphate mannosyltransferase
MDRLRLAIAVPTYNEAANIKVLIPLLAKAVAKCSNIDTTVFVIDDNSPDKTGEAALEVGKEYKNSNFKVEVLARKKKEGLGKAYVYAFNKILSKKFDYILQMDADLSHDPKYIPQFLDKASEAEFVVGSRYIKGGSTPDWTWSRKLQSRGGNWYSRVFLGSIITDYTGGYNLYSAGLLKRIDFNKLQAGGYGFLIELKYSASLKSDKIIQIPIIFKDRQHGNSKIPRNTIFKNFLLVPQIKSKFKDN